MKHCIRYYCAATLFLSIGSAFGQVTTNQIYKGLVSYWPLDQINSITNGANITFETPDVANGNNMTAIGSPSIVAGVFGNAVAFNGGNYLVVTNSAIPVTNNAAGNLATGLPIYNAGAYTVAMWVQGVAQETKFVFTEGNSLQSEPILLLETGSAATTTSNFDGYVRNNEGFAAVNHLHSKTTCFDGTWHHLAWVDNYGVVSLYIDGNLDPLSSTFAYYPSSLISSSAESSAGTFLYTMPMNTTVIGGLVRNTAAGSFNGSVDDVAIWQRPLSQAEVQFVMTNSIPQPVPVGPPVFLNPFTGWTNSMGDYAVLQSSVVPPATVQWFENGAMIPNATNAALIVIDLTSPGTNYYSVVANNAWGPSTNGPAPLVVVTDAVPQLTLGCFGYWPMNTVNMTDSATNTPDIYLGNNFNLVNMGSSNLVPGEFSEALAFPGGSSYGDVAGTSALPFIVTNYSISFWVNGFGAVAANTYIYENSSTASANPLLGFSCPQNTTVYTTNLCVFLRTDQNIALIPSVLSSNSVLDGTWHHLVWVDQCGSAMLYVDGVLDGASFSYIRTNLNQALRANTNSTLTLNAEAVGALFRTSAGSEAQIELDDLAWWNRRLSYTEIQMLQTNPVPQPTGIIAATISQQPLSLTNAYVGDADAFTVGSTGSQPITYTWYYNTNTNYTGAVISSKANPSAATAALTFTNVQLTNAGYYYVTVSNGAAPGSGLSGGGVQTSAVVQLAVHNYTSPPIKTNQIVLQLQILAIDYASPGAVQPGFQTINLNSGATVFNNTTKVTISPLNGALLQDRNRTGDVVNMPPLLNSAPLYCDEIFYDGNVPGAGIDILIQHLAPNTKYGVNIWSYDPVATDFRFSDWTEAISGATIMYQYSYGPPLPVADFDKTFGDLLTSDPNGQLDIQGAVDPSFTAEVSVFLNALVITANPVPQILTNYINTADGNLFISAQAQYSGQTIVFQESPDLRNWQNASDGLNATQVGPIFTSEFPVSANPMFYRVVYQPLGPQP